MSQNTNGSYSYEYLEFKDNLSLASVRWHHDIFQEEHTIATLCTAEQDLWLQWQLSMTWLCFKKMNTPMTENNGMSKS